MNYRSLSSVARVLLPRAEEMHHQGMTWRQISRELKISKSTLYIWRRLEKDSREGSRIKFHVEV